jgi:hypothetical protein
MLLKTLQILIVLVQDTEASRVGSVVCEYRRPDHMAVTLERLQAEATADVPDLDCAVPRCRRKPGRVV